MKKIFLTAALLCSLLLAAPAFGQSSNASLGGTISDTSGAVIPGVAVTATNTATGVVNTAVSNSVGIYNFPSLLPGTYKVSAEHSGFQPHTYTDVLLGNAAQVRLNFQLQVGGVSTAIEVSVAADRLLLESSSSTGDVLAEQAVLNLPQVNSNALDMVRVMSGYIPVDGNAVFNADGTTVGGVSVANLNLQRDGVSISDVRFPAGIHSPTQINPDMVGELRIIQSPVDAEMGRGNAQIQVMTKSGSNDYHGSVVWDAQNSGLDSNQWENNRSAVVPPWRNLHQYTLSLGGPIIKNKTFFFALFNGQIARLRDSQNPLALTACARKGIFRYYDSWNNGRYGQVTTTAGTPTIAVVDFNGNPVAPTTNPDGSAHNGILRYASVFGPLLNAPQTNDCSDFDPATDVDWSTSWDPYRKAVDSTGYIDYFLSLMPEATSFESIGDGLNTAGGRWTRGTRGADNMYGIGEDNNRKQINIKVDHVFNANHRINASWSLEKSWADNNFKVWPQGWGGRTERQPQVWTVNFTSTITPTLLNEARFGLMRTGNNGYFPLENPETGKELQSHLPEINGLPVVVSPGTGAAAFTVASSNFFGGRGALLGWTNQDLSPRYTYGDTITWIKGKHSIKAGGEIRLSGTKSKVYGTGWGWNANPYAVGGNATALAVQGINSTNMPGLTGTALAGNRRAMENLLTFLSGSLGSVQQTYFVNSAKNLSSWNDPLTEKQKIRDMHKNEFAIFVKDDWKVTSDLTLNLGLRYEYYGVPYLKSGLTAALKGGGNAVYGISGRSWNEAFWNAGERADMTELVFVGPGSPNPDQRIYARDMNNFGPAVGFAWQIPWFGKGKTTIRGGYQVTFQTADNLATVEGIIANPPGSTTNAGYTPSNIYLSLENMNEVIPVTPTANPMQPVPLTDRTQTITAYDPNFVSPYIQNVTLSIARNIGRSFTVDVRYVGTFSRKNPGSINVNMPNFLTNGLLEAFNAARYGDDTNPAVQLLDDIFAPVRGTTSGAAYLRASTRAAAGQQARAMLAMGNYQALANLINAWSNPSAPKGTTDNGWLLRTAGFPENFIVTNPQFSTVNLRTNRGNSNYHSMQTQVTMRPKAGLSFQLSYTLSKNLGNLGGTPSDPRNIAWDYGVLSSDRRHAFTSYGTFDLPVGPNRQFFNGASGTLARILEGWQTSWILSVTSGSPANVTAQNMLYGTGVPDLVGTFPFDKIGVSWEPNAYQGNYFGDYFQNVNDPQVAMVTDLNNLRNYCTLTAVADPDGNIVLQNPMPGTLGSFGRNRFYGPSTWSLDMAISKSVKIDESKRVEVRVDATNIFNHPQPGGSRSSASTRIYFANPPDLNINSANPFGYLGTKVGSRTFQARLRFNF
ncbi:MAG: TonB-dependent receptor [Acidobacteria bacterium]|nr:TonB-dependent receptor [Acidobacteriota bacterium]